MLNVSGAKKQAITIMHVLTNFHAIIVFPLNIILKDVHKKLFVLDATNLAIWSTNVLIKIRGPIVTTAKENTLKSAVS